MKTSPRNWYSQASAVLLILACFLIPSAAFSAAHSFSDKELQTLLAPVALYPDSLLGNILVASTYPDDVIEADQWIADHPSLDANKISEQTKSKKWANVVKTLLLTPDVLAMMVDDMDWTDDLAEAYVTQQSDVMKAIQSLRRQAQKAGNLKSEGNVSVCDDGNGNIIIGSTDPTVIVVPQYEPTVVYGWDPGRIVATTALVWGTVATLNWIFDCSVWDWHGCNIWVGPSYNFYHYGPNGFAPWDPHHDPHHGPHGPHHPPNPGQPPYHPEHHYRDNGYRPHDRNHSRQDNRPGSSDRYKSKQHRDSGSAHAPAASTHNRVDNRARNTSDTKGRVDSRARNTSTTNSRVDNRARNTNDTKGHVDNRARNTSDTKGRVDSRTRNTSSAQSRDSQHNDSSVRHQDRNTHRHTSGSAQHRNTSGQSSFRPTSSSGFSHADMHSAASAAAKQGNSTRVNANSAGRVGSRTGSGARHVTSSSSYSGGSRQHSHQRSGGRRR